MKKKLLIERSEKQRTRNALMASTLVAVILLAAWGIASFVESLMDKVTCNGFYSCMMQRAGSVMMVFIGIFLCWIVLMLLYYFAFKWKEIEPKTDTKKKQSTRRKT